MNDPQTTGSDQVGYFYTDANNYGDWHMVIALAAMAKSLDLDGKVVDILNEIIGLAQKNTVVKSGK